MVSIHRQLRDDVYARIREAFGEPNLDQAAFAAVGHVVSALRSDPPSSARFAERWREQRSGGPVDYTRAYVEVARALEPEFDELDPDHFAHVCARALELSFEGETRAATRSESTDVANAAGLTLTELHGQTIVATEALELMFDHLLELSGSWRERVARLSDSDRSMLARAIDETRWKSAHVKQWRGVGLAALARGWESGHVVVQTAVWVRVANVEAKWRAALASALSIAVEDVAPTLVDPPPPRPEVVSVTGSVSRARVGQFERTTRQRVESSVKSTLRDLARSRVEFGRGGVDAVTEDLVAAIFADPESPPTVAQLAEQLSEHPAVFEMRASRRDLEACLDGVLYTLTMSRRTEERDE